MLYNIEPWLKMIFLITSLIWISRILIVRSDKQIVINPILLLIATLLAFVNDLNNNDTILIIQSSLYFMYIVIVLLGLYTTKKDRFF